MKTEREVPRAGDSGDTIPEQANVYVPPRPLAALADHRTMDVKAIRLAAGVDSRQAPTELRLNAPPLIKKDNSWIAPLLLALLAVGFIGLWWVTPEPLPLGTTGPSVPAAPAVRATAEVLTPVARPRVVPVEPPLDAVGPEMPSTPTAPTPTAESAPTAATAPTEASPGLRTPTAVPQPAAPPVNHRAKPHRDPWLE